MNISSLVIRTAPEETEEIVKVLIKTEYCEYHLHDEKGHIIVTIEAEGVNDEVKIVRQLQQLEHVTSVEMIYAYSEDELDKEREHLRAVEDNLPGWLNDEKATAKDIRYHGDVRGKM